MIANFFSSQRKNLILELKNQGIKDKKVLDAINKIPREKFVLKNYENQAYKNIPLPIGFSQTISQPYTVVFMLEALELKKADKVLEIGTGSGYNAAILSLIVKKVFTVESIKELSIKAKNSLKIYKNVKVIYGDGSIGYRKESPYDKIIVTATAPDISIYWKNQLKNKGIIVCPIGYMTSKMLKIKKQGNNFTEENLGLFNFVPLTGKEGFQ